MSSDLHIAEAVLGRDAHDFLSSDIGRYVVGQCDIEIAEAQEKLATVNPWRRDRIRQLQNEIWRAQSLKGWLVGLVIGPVILTLARELWEQRVRDLAAADVTDSKSSVFGRRS